MDRGIVVKGAIEGDVCLDGEDHRLGASFLELEQRLAFSVSSEVLIPSVLTRELSFRCHRLRPKSKVFGQLMLN